MPKQWQSNGDNTYSMTDLKDDHMMPFGKYGPDQGDPRMMANVPDDYLQWLYDSALAGKINRGTFKQVEDYCIENAAALGIVVFKRG